MSFLIKLDDVSKTYTVGINQVAALQNIHLTITRGVMAAIVGVSGSGKSTLMNLIGLLDQCTQGHYYFEGMDVSTLSEPERSTIRNQKVGFVFQSFFLLPRSNALQNVMLPLFYRGVSRLEAKVRAMEVLDQVGISHLADRKPNELSGGQQQRVAIARALVGNPSVILADEPTGALDSQTSKEVMDLLIHLNKKEGRTIIIITHDNHISRSCEQVVTIKDGRIVTG